MNINKAIINKDNTCMKCLSEYAALRIIEIPELGYGSGFDGLSTKIQLCENCYKETNSDWWEFEVIKDGYCEEYKHEKEIFEYIHTMPLAGQELIYNSFAGGSFANVNWEPQDWIDYELDILPHEKCKEYNAYSPEERQAYKDRFPTCNWVEKRIYQDGSFGHRCHRNASGNLDGNSQPSTECYMCKNYQPRKDTMKIINVSEEILERERQRLSEMISYATKNLELLNSDPQKFYEQNEE